MPGSLHRRRIEVGPAQLAQAGASELLALDPRVLAAGGYVEIPEAAAPVETTQGVALIPIEGPLAQRASEGLCGYLEGYDALGARIAAALGDPNVGAVVLRVNSPGGDVAGLEQAIGRIRAARERAQKPIYAFVDETAASAAYWLAATVCDGGIWTPAAAQMGCLGVLGVAVDRSAQLAAQGIKLVVAAAPAGKAEQAPGGPVTEETAKRMGEKVAATWSRMVASISGAREALTPKALQALDAAVLVGAAAVAAGLADGVVEGLNEVIDMATAEVARRSSMDKIKASLGLGADATEGDVVKAIETQSGAAKLGAQVLEETKAQSANEALGLVRAWGTSHREAETERAARDAERQVAEDKERRELVARKVVAGFEIPAQAWADADGKMPARKYAEMPLEALRAEVAVYERQPRGQTPPKATKAADAPAGEDDERLAASAGVDAKYIQRARQSIRFA